MLEVRDMIFDVIFVPDTPDKMFRVVGIILVLCVIGGVVWSIYQYFN